MRTSAGPDRPYDPARGTRGNHPDRRTLAYVERGNADGVPVIVCHGTPGSRLTRHPDSELYARHGVRMIVYDRPGYGRSDPQPGRSVADAAADIETITDSLELDR